MHDESIIPIFDHFLFILFMSVSEKFPAIFNLFSISFNFETCEIIPTFQLKKKKILFDIHIRDQLYAVVIILFNL